VAFPTASVLATLEVNSGASDSAALVSAQDGQYLRSFTNPLRSGDYSTSVLDPATGVAWLVSSAFIFGGGGGGRGKKQRRNLLFFDFVVFFSSHHFLTHEKRKPSQSPKLQLSEQGQTYSTTGSNNWVSREGFVFEPFFFLRGEAKKNLRREEKTKTHNSLHFFKTNSNQNRALWCGRLRSRKLNRRKLFSRGGERARRRYIEVFDKRRNRRTRKQHQKQ
jgi:hypothetical protein